MRRGKDGLVGSKARAALSWSVLLNATGTAPSAEPEPRKGSLRAK